MRLRPLHVVFCASTCLMLAACGPGYSEMGTPGAATTTENSTTTGGTTAAQSATTTGGSGTTESTGTTGGKSTTTTGTTTGGTTTTTTTAGATTSGASTGSMAAGSTTGTNSACPNETDTYTNYAGAFLSSKCGGCHGFVSSYAAVSNNAAAIQGRIDNGSMPTSGPLSGADQNRINEWFNCGLPE